MHAKELGATAGLAAALANGDHERAESLLAAAPGYPGGAPPLGRSWGESLMGPLPPTALLDQTRNGEVVELEWEGDRYLLRTALMDDARVTFVRNLNDEMAIVPELRRAGLMLLMATLAFALVVGGAFASRLARPIGALASAADRLAAATSTRRCRLPRFRKSSRSERPSTSCGSPWRSACTSFKRRTESSPTVRRGAAASRPS